MRAFGGAFLATSSAAFSTVLYLYFSHEQPWASRFIQLYSLVGMISGWMNTAVLQLGPRYPALQKKSVGFCLWAVSSGLTTALYSLLFSKTLTWLEIAATASLLSPISYAAIYSGAFAVGDASWVYKRATLFNLLLLAGGALALPLGQSHESLCLGITLAALGIMPCFFLEKRKPGARKEGRADLPAAFLNPSLPTLERSVWDQWVLHRLSLEPVSWGLYLLTRVVTFAGNVLFSFLMGVQANEETAHAITPKLSGWLLLLNSLLLAATAISGQNIVYLIFGNLIAWQISLLLAAYYQNHQRRPYYVVGVAWVVTLVLRLGFLQKWPDIHYYSISQAIASWVIVSLLYLVMLKGTLTRSKSG